MDDGARDTGPDRAPIVGVPRVVRQGQKPDPEKNISQQDIAKQGDPQGGNALGSNALGDNPPGRNAQGGDSPGGIPMGPNGNIEPESKHTDPRSFAVRGVAAALQMAIPLAIAAATIFNNGKLGALWFLAPVALLVIAVNFAMAYLHWLRFTYMIGDDDIRVESGIISRSARSVPYERIQDVSLEQKLIPRLFGLVEVRFETGAGGDEELTLAYLAEGDGEKLRQLVRARRDQVGISQDIGGAQIGGPQIDRAESTADAGSDGEGPVDASADAPADTDDQQILFQMDGRRLFQFGLFEFSLAVFAVLGGLMQYVETFTSIELYDPDLWRGLVQEQGAKLSALGLVAQIMGALVGLGFLLFIGSATGLVRTYLRDWGFTLEKTTRGFRRRRGLLTRTDVVMPGHRVQAVKIGTGLIRNRFGWKSLNFVSLAQDSGSSNHVVAPFAQEGEIAPIIQAAGFMPPDATLDWHRTSTAYRFDTIVIELAIIALATIPIAIFAPKIFLAIPAVLTLAAILGNFYAWKFRRHALGHGQIYSTRGLLAPKTQIAAQVKLHSIELSQGPIARRRGYATVHLGLAGGSFAIPGVELGRARQLRQAILASISARDFSQLT